ncbi:response regulator receiver modulated CheW protein [Desulfonatronospira thiodismutans ASO3-1]|uniref:Response regulator receiver modulated CheW protein n=1 Tax=Desulfonatronospira thiodismutans ASO3-1 TaxID=555779 RepID=D6SMQ7_9BACT|nr:MULTISPECIES: chemotaxis protein [Desulfonatronospira]EFI35968.1 response regulator receiver modulated CheW protein [Desulfonatronospira thiodismutans ASO3-1]RQD79318.1 MAG: chemotaxis signal transduction protein CheV [Desulfonatronospira sp. MSAO_Bac3]
MTNSDILLEAGTNELEIVEFFLDEDLDGESYQGFYGVNVAKVLRIINKPEVTEMPSTPHSCVLGAFNQRSRIIPLVDLGLWLDKQAVESGSSKVIITEFNRVVTGFLASGVTRIHRLSWDEVEPPDAYVDSFSAGSITGVVKIEDRIVFILDLEKILAELSPGMGMNLDQELQSDSESGYTALVADDSTLIRNMISDLLEKAGFRVIKFKNGQEAWNELEKIKNTCSSEDKSLDSLVHIVVSDIEMPAMDGLTLTRKIKNDSVLGNLPVILFSSLISDRLRHKGVSVGADDQVSKPEVSLLTQKAMKLIRDREQSFKSKF